MNISPEGCTIPTKQPRLHLTTAGKLWIGYLALIAVVALVFA